MGLTVAADAGVQGRSENSWGAATGCRYLRPLTARPALCDDSESPNRLPGWGASTEGVSYVASRPPPGGTGGQARGPESHCVLIGSLGARDCACWGWFHDVTALAGAGVSSAMVTELLAATERGGLQPTSVRTNHFWLAWPKACVVIASMTLRTCPSRAAPCRDRRK
jgi:hypothetical protein